MGKNKAIRKKRFQKKKRKVRVKRGRDGKIEVLVEGTSRRIVKKQKKKKMKKKAK